MSCCFVVPNLRTDCADVLCDRLVKNIRARSEIAPTVPVRISSPRPRVARAMGGKSALSKLTTDVPVFTPPNSPAVQRW